MKFGAANSAAHQETTQNVENKQAVDDGKMKALEGYFDNLAAASVNEKLVLEQLVANNTNLAANNKRLIAMVKKLIATSRTSDATTPASRKLGKSAGVRPSATIVRGRYIMLQMHATSSQKTKTSAPLVGESCCDGVGRSA